MCNIPFGGYVTCYMRKIFTVLAIVLTCKLSFAQSFNNDRLKSVVNGRVIDSVSRTPLAFVTATLVSAKDSTAKHSLTDSLGNYQFTGLENNKYFIKFSMAGYRSGRTDDFSVNDSLKTEIRPFLMVPVSIELNAVVITAARRPVVPRIDGFTYIAGNDIQAAGETASDLLRKLPAILVNPDGGPTIRGSSAIKVFIDDRPSETFAASVTDALKQVPSENIARIEVITQPSARYDAEGVDAVILIYTKRQLNKGLSGSVNGLGSNRNSSLTANINMLRNKWTTGTGVGYYYNNNPSGSNLIRNVNGSAINLLTQDRETESQSNSIYATINTRYAIDSLSSWNAGYRLGNSWKDDENKYINNISVAGGMQQFSRNINATNFTVTHNLYGGYVKKYPERKAELNLMGHFFYQTQSGNYDLTQLQAEKQSYAENNQNSSDNKEVSIQSDFKKQFKNNSTLETGIKSTYRYFTNNSNFVILDPVQGQYQPDLVRSNSFRFGRQVYAAYASYLFNLQEWKIRTGLRYEHTLLNLNFGNSPIKVPDYKNLIPMLLFSRSFSDNHQISLGYSKRISRPTIVSLNPIVNYIDTLSQEFGNPMLRPVVTHAIEGSYSYSYKALMVNTAIFFNQNNNGIENIRTLKPGGIVESTYLNIAVNRNIGGTVSVSYRNGKWSFNTNHSIRFVEYKVKEISYLSNGFVSGHYLNIGYKFNKDLNAEVSGTLNPGQINYQSLLTGSQWYSLLVNKTFNKGNMGISLRLDNIATPKQYINEKLTSANFQQTSRSYYPVFLTRLGAFYKIGKKEVKVPSTWKISEN